MTAGDLAGLNHPDPVGLRSNVALVIDQASSQVLFEKNSSCAPHRLGHQADDRAGGGRSA
jgi:D-alanyl-D-alanine carboxypeptidase